MKRLTEDKVLFIESLFVKEDMKTTKKSGSRLRMTGERLQAQGITDDYRVYLFTYYLQQMKKYGTAIGHENVIGEFAASLSEAVTMINEFPDYLELVESKRLQNKIIKYIKLEVNRLMYQAANPEAKQTGDKQGNYYMHMKTDSLERLQDVAEMNNTHFDISDENRLISIDEDEYYEFNEYVKHFLKNKERVLTRKQLEFYEVMKEVYAAKGEGNKIQIIEEAGYTYNQFKNFLETIRNRQAKDFQKFGKNKSLSEDKRIKFRRVLEQFIQTADDDSSLQNQRLYLTRIIQDNYENEDFEIIITNGLDTEEKRNIVRAVKGKELVENKVLYKVYANIDEHLNKVPFAHIEPSKVKGEYTEDSKVDRAARSNHFELNANGSLHSLEDAI